MAKLQSYKQRMGWTFPWASSNGTDFNPDFQAGIGEQQSGVAEYNFREFELSSSAAPAEQTYEDWAATTGTDWATYTKDSPGMSAFALDDGVVFHTYSAYARGLDSLWGMYQWLDRAPLGRNEARSENDPLNFFRRRDEY